MDAETRSRSPHDRRKSRSRERDRKDADRRRTRSRSPRKRQDRPRERRRSGSPRSRHRHSRDDRERSRRHGERRRSRDRDRRKDEEEAANFQRLPDELPTSQEEMTEEEKILQSMMGFAGFDSTKEKKVDGNEASAVSINKKRRYRQYMNRRGGFNRPLDPIT